MIIITDGDYSLDLIPYARVAEFRAPNLRPVLQHTHSGLRHLPPTYLSIISRLSGKSRNYVGSTLGSLALGDAVATIATIPPCSSFGYHPINSFTVRPMPCSKGTYTAIENLKTYSRSLYSSNCGDVGEMWSPRPLHELHRCWCRMSSCSPGTCS